MSKQERSPPHAELDATAFALNYLQSDANPNSVDDSAAVLMQKNMEERRLESEWSFDTSLDWESAHHASSYADSAAEDDHSNHMHRLSAEPFIKSAGYIKFLGMNDKKPAPFIRIQVEKDESEEGLEGLTGMNLRRYLDRRFLVCCYCDTL